MIIVSSSNNDYFIGFYTTLLNLQRGWRSSGLLIDENRDGELNMGLWIFEVKIIS